MSKAILLLDEMPVRCIDCPCMYVVKNSHISEYCKAIIDKKDCYLKIENVCERPKWCPLKPMPERRYALQGMIGYEGTKRECKGYNRCIDEIEGEEE